ncbi:GntR family transcriptional regulator [Paraburkholderia hiiakae]|uniref:GntR family transcriptional regulator n=1 Tax=Paraburkholderia hiiakae TaxID=1081782 RepID=UPI001917D341|nr:GntR family transcriptional regulator [Paraburkholderia hiiakae]
MIHNELGVLPGWVFTDTTRPFSGQNGRNLLTTSCLNNNNGVGLPQAFRDHIATLFDVGLSGFSAALTIQTGADENKERILNPVYKAAIMTTLVEKIAKAPTRTALKQTTLTETIYQEVRARLQRGDIGTNERILDYEIADDFGCTRMPVRQALVRLVNEGYLVGTTRGFVMPRLTNDDIHEIFEVRRLLEPSAAAGATAALTDEQHGALKRAYQKAVRACEKQDRAAMITANVEFRDVWLSAVQNSRLQDTIRRFADHAQQVRSLTLTDASTQKIALGGMHDLLESFLERDAKRARTVMLEFILNAEQRYFVLIDGQDQ